MDVVFKNALDLSFTCYLLKTSLSLYRISDHLKGAAFRCCADLNRYFGGIWHKCEMQAISSLSIYLSFGFAQTVKLLGIGGM
jgi:hypothetical protein